MCQYFKPLQTGRGLNAVSKGKSSFKPLQSVQNCRGLNAVSKVNSSFKPLFFAQVLNPFRQKAFKPLPEC